MACGVNVEIAEHGVWCSGGDCRTWREVFCWHDRDVEVAPGPRHTANVYIERVGKSLSKYL
jgi:hypothetical protein